MLNSCRPLRKRYFLMSSYCPKCNATNMTYGEPSVSYQAYTIELPLTCIKCKHQWIDVYIYNSTIESLN